MGFFKEYANKTYKENKYSVFGKVKDEDKGFNHAFIIQKDGTDTQYLVKEMDKKNPCEIFFHLEVLRKIAKEKGIYQQFEAELEKKIASKGTSDPLINQDRLQKAVDEYLKDFMDDLLAPYSEIEFRAQLEIYTGEFIRSIRKKCSPKYRLFRVEKENTDENKEDQTVLVGSKFKKYYVDSKDAYKPENHLTNQAANLFDKIITDDFCLVDADASNKPIPIDYLGACAVLRYVVGRLDCHNENWGFDVEDTKEHYPVCMVDFGRCFAVLDSKEKLNKLVNLLIRLGEDAVLESILNGDDDVLEDEDQLIVKNLNNIIKIVFEAKYDSSSAKISSDSFSKYSPDSHARLFSKSYSKSTGSGSLPLPKAVYESDRIRLEIIETIKDLAKLSRQDIINELKKHFYKFPCHLEVLADEVEASVEYLHLLMQLSFKLQAKLISLLDKTETTQVAHPKSEEIEPEVSSPVQKKAKIF